MSLKPNPLRLPLGVQSDHRVDPLDVSVDAAQILGVLRRVGHLLERLERLQVEEPRNSLYRGTPRSRTRRTSIEARSMCVPSARWKSWRNRG